MRILKKIISFMFSRLFLVAIMLAIQLLLIWATVILASMTGLYAILFFNFISFIMILAIISNNENPSYKITWIIAILSMPLTGGVFYLLLGNKRMSPRLSSFASSAISCTRENMPDNSLGERLHACGGALALQSRHIYNMSGYPAWEDCHSEYFSLGELMFERMIEELEKAERYIFMEYFIITPGEMWDKIFAVLREKAQKGVEVRLMYDDLGCIRLPKRYNELIREAGIRLRVFNPFQPRLSVILNYRDHRKLCVIDGKTAFCGGINIADEYINRRRRYGHWKDTGVMIRGPAVWGFSFMYLQQWDFAANADPKDYEAYRCTLGASEKPKGMVQVFGDSPLDRVNVTESAYLNIISRATGYVYITTPYLVIDYEMETALCAAAQSGVDVRIITPCRYDKWYVHILTRSHYPRLLRAGVRIFEYTPGFMHGKSYVSDDSVCMVGTCNMDFRSFYLHFECSAAFYQSDTVISVKDDFLSCQKLSREITLEESLRVSFFGRVLRSFLKIFAPLM